MKLAYYISRRLRLGVSGGSRASAVIAVCGVALSLMVMEFTLAVVVGFKDGIRGRLTGFDAQVTVYAGESGQALTVTPGLEDIVSRQAGSDVSLRRVIRRPGMLKTDSAFQGVVYIAQSTADDFAFERGNMVEGEWPDFEADSTANSIVMSAPLASTLGLSVGDKVYSTFIVDGEVKVRRHTVAGLYRSSFGEYDMTVVYASPAGMRKVAGLADDECDRLDIRGLDDDEVETVASQLGHRLMTATVSGELPGYYIVDNIHRTGALYFNWLALLDTNVAVILVLMLAVAGFTLVSSLFIIVLERVRTIGVLRTLGTSRRMIRTIFVNLGLRLVAIGMIAGNIIALGLLSLQYYTGVVPLDPDMYYLSSVPVEIDVVAFIALNIGVALVAWLILFIPARTAAATDPARAIASGD